jgi:hypothetical protein
MAMAIAMAMAMAKAGMIHPPLLSPLHLPDKAGKGTFC